MEIAQEAVRPLVSQEQEHQPVVHQPMLYAQRDESLRKEAVEMGLECSCAAHGGLCVDFAGFVRNGDKPVVMPKKGIVLVVVATQTVKLVICRRHHKLPLLINDAVKCKLGQAQPISPV